MRPEFVEPLRADIYAVDTGFHRPGRAPTADRHATLKRGLADAYRRRLAEHGIADVDAKLSLLGLDIELNAQGLGVWFDRTA